MEKNLITVPIDDMPDLVHEPYGFLLDNTGVEPVVERSGYGRILLTHFSDRVKMTIQFRLNNRKWQWEQSRLWVDGERTPLATSWEMYVAIFKNPDTGRRDFTPKGARKAKFPVSQPVDEQYLPKAVATEVAGLRKMNRKDVTTVVPTIVPKANQYVITVDGGDGQKFVFVFSLTTGQWQVTDMMLVNASGYDVTAYIGEHQIEGFLHEIMGIVGRATQVTNSPLGAVSGAATTNSVNVRKSTVFRI